MSKKLTKNKGEHSELLVFLKILSEPKLYLSDIYLNKKSTYFKVNKLTTHNMDNFYINNGNTIQSYSKKSNLECLSINRNFLNEQILAELSESIINGNKTFEISKFNEIADTLKINNASGGASSQKSDIILAIELEELNKADEGFSIKSYLGNKPTLLNASKHTNFIFKLSKQDITKELKEKINNISSRTKIKDRFELMKQHNIELIFDKTESPIMDYNLKMIDSQMPKIISYLILFFYKDKINKISELVNKISNDQAIMNILDMKDELMLKKKIKDFLIAFAFGCFSSKKWNGIYEANGLIILKRDKEIVGLHIIEKETLEDFLFNSIFLETPSTARHGSAIIEKIDTDFIFKLNLQLRLD